MQELRSHIDKLHTTELGIDRIKNNLNLNTNDVVDYCKRKIMDKNCMITKKGKNYYCEIDHLRITVNSYSYTIITAKLWNQKKGALNRLLNLYIEDLHKKQ